ncbi:hypothetical protein TEQG_08442 [Trichophyton equinum CBS 127.97]|uniref:Uncharacterized protein n=1 Tax=Trichophyton equinum (strain ATCC MYA-4606 / CBS 127.97) TaxID=559882 RepID=F2Q5U5_TRIEC|nr:hypothetical protein TEQG_08442 [Trichophyton equinum CBS 127.97]
MAPLKKQDLGPAIPFSLEKRGNPFQILESQDSEMEVEFPDLPPSPTPQPRVLQAKKRAQFSSPISPKIAKTSNLEVILNLLEQEIKAEKNQDILDILEEQKRQFQQLISFRLKETESLETLLQRIEQRIQALEGVKEKPSIAPLKENFSFQFVENKKPTYAKVLGNQSLNQKGSKEPKQAKENLATLAPKAESTPSL